MHSFSMRLLLAGWEGLIVSLCSFFPCLSPLKTPAQSPSRIFLAACVTLDADVAANHGVIAPADEQMLSTARIQDALDHCAPARQESKSVILRAHGKKNVFLTGPLTLRAGVTLVVDKNTALVASRDPRVYDLSPGSCGIVRRSTAADASRSSPATAPRTPASWARAPSTAAAAQSCSGRTSPGGTSRTKPKSKTSSRASPP